MIMMVLCVSGCGTLPGQLATASGAANVSSASGDVQRPVARSDGVVATEASVSGTSEVSVEVTLIPIEGPRTAGSRMSLAAMQALGAPLGDLVEVDVFGF